MIVSTGNSLISSSKDYLNKLKTELESWPTLVLTDQVNIVRKIVYSLIFDKEGLLLEKLLETVPHCDWAAILLVLSQDNRYFSQLAIQVLKEKLSKCP